jgi:hypothetical protein
MVDIEGSDEKEHVKQFVFEASEAYLWLRTARRLKRAADKLYPIYKNASRKFVENILKIEKERAEKSNDITITGEEQEYSDDMELIRVHRFLIALALENLFKGILIARNPNYVKADGSLSPELTNHDLVKLAEKCRFSLCLDKKSLVVVTK